MLDKEYIKELKDILNKLDETKDDIITKGIRINRLSKSIIYSLIRGDIKSAEDYMKQMDNLKQEVEELVKKYPMFRHRVSINFQEYVEAKVFYAILTNKKIPTHKDLNVWPEEYLLGVMDVAGELHRKATEEMINNNIEFGFKVKDILESLYLQLLEIEFKNFELRKKLDYVSNTLNWLIEKLFYKTNIIKPNKQDLNNKGGK